jgi:hypothetical protein
MVALLVATFSMTEGASVLVDRKEAKVEKDGHTYDNVTDSTAKHGGPTEEKLDARMGKLFIILSHFVCNI